MSTVMRIFDVIQYPKPTLPRAIGIDEFKGDTSGEKKHQRIITDVTNRRVLDILPNRFSNNLTHYFKECNRDNVEFFVSDMGNLYAELANNSFSKATQIVDKYHYIRQAIWVFEAVRKQEQAHFSAGIANISSIPNHYLQNALNFQSKKKTAGKCNALFKRNVIRRSFFKRKVPF